MALYALVLAGGSGERFWPLSRRTRPKQLLSLFSRETLLEATLARLEGLVPPENTIVLTNREQEAAVRELLPGLSPENIVAEPEKRDTAAAIALGVGLVSRRDRHATMVVLPADQLINDKAGFQRTIRTAAHVARQTEGLVTIGVKPTWPCTFFGYIEQGRRVGIQGLSESDPAVFEVSRFREKPAAELAESFLRDGGFRWNAGIFVWTVQGILRELDRHVPALASFVERLHAGSSLEETIAKEFSTLPKASIDYAIMERASKLYEVEAAFDWDDVGNWIAASQYWEKDEAGNASNVEVTTVDATNNIVFADPAVSEQFGTPGLRVALVGVDDVIVVQTHDALLVCNRHEADKIKKLVAKLPRELQ